MPRVHVYVPEHLHRRRHELPPEVTLSSLLAKGFMDYLDAHEAESNGQKRPRKKSA